MPTESQVSNLLKKLIRETVEGELKWEEASLPRSLSRGTDDIVDEFLAASYRGQQIGVFERKFQAFDGDRDYYYWTSDARLVFLHSDSVVWETADDQPRIWSLLKLAKESAADIDNVMKGLLSDHANGQDD